MNNEYDQMGINLDTYDLMTTINKVASGLIDVKL